MAFLPTVETVGSVPQPVWTNKKILLTPEFDHRTAPLAAGKYIDCTTLASLKIMSQNITVMCTVSCTVGHEQNIVVVLVLILLLLWLTEFGANSVSVTFMSYKHGVCI